MQSTILENIIRPNKYGSRKRIYCLRTKCAKFHTDDPQLRRETTSERIICDGRRCYVDMSLGNAPYFMSYVYGSRITKCGPLRRFILRRRLLGIGSVFEGFVGFFWVFECVVSILVLGQLHD